MAKAKPQINKVCTLCGDNYTSSLENSKCCNKIKTFSCKFCLKDFQKQCRTRKHKTCSRDCAAKHIDREIRKRNTRECKSCNEIFEGLNSQAVYCNVVKTFPCLGCENTFERPCSLNNPNNYCSTSCRNKTMRARNYNIVNRVCIVCHEDYKPVTSRQKICNSSHIRTCELCSDEFEITSNQVRKKQGFYCSNSCSTLAQMNTKLDKNKIKEYKDPNQWAINFKKKHKRKPTKSDFKAYFNTSFPSNIVIDRKLFLKRRASRWEQIVIQYIEEYYPDLEFKTNRKILDIKDGKNLKEIDILIESLELGIEIQDFATHSKDKENEISKTIFRSKSEYKHGPRYHEAKRLAAESMGIVLIDIWEDQIIDGSYKTIVDYAIELKLDIIRTTS